MTEHQPGNTQPDPHAVTFDGFSEPPPSRAISWETGHEINRLGELSDTTTLYIADDEEGVPCWWREDIEDTVGNRSEAEQISFEEVLDTVEPKYWPVVFSWTLEAIVYSEGWHDSDQRWRGLLTANPDAAQQLKEILVALMPHDTDQDRLNRRLSRQAAEYHGQLIPDPE
jgi:hypothetical protein